MPRDVFIFNVEGVDLVLHGDVGHVDHTHQIQENVLSSLKLKQNYKIFFVIITTQRWDFQTKIF